MALQIIRSRFDDRTLYECEADSMLEALQKAVKARANLTRASLTRANLDGANLDGANLTRASLDGANLDGANLTRASLTRANLDGANLDGANLDGASLYGANLTRASLDGKPILNIVQLAGIGSARRNTTAIILADEIRIQCGCFSGTLPEFVAQINTTHKDNPRYLEEYIAAVAWIQSCADAVRKHTAA